MAPTVKPKKPLKSMEKLVDNPTIKKKKRRNFDSYALYLYQVLRTFDQEMGISRQAMMIMNSFVMDTMENLAVEAGRLVAHSKSNTLGSREIQSAIRLSIPGELGKHCHVEALKALTMYQRNQPSNK